MALTRDNPRKFDISDFSAVTAGTTIFEGAAVVVVKATGLAIGGTFDPSLHRFSGFAKSKAAVGQRVTLQPKGRIILTVVGATDASNNAAVHASDDDTFNLSGTGVSVGRVAWHQGAGVCVVDFDAATDVDGGLVRDSAGNIIANVNLRTGLIGTASTGLMSLAGGNGEISVPSDARALVLHNGVAAQARKVVTNYFDEMAITTGVVGQSIAAATVAIVDLDLAAFDPSARINLVTNAIVYPTTVDKLRLTGLVNFAGHATPGTYRKFILQGSFNGTTFFDTDIKLTVVPVAGATQETSLPISITAGNLGFRGFRFQLIHDAGGALATSAFLNIEASL